MEQNKGTSGKLCVGRRQFLLWGGGAATVVSLGTLWMGCDGDQKAVFAKYPSKKVVNVGDLKSGTPVSFKYPDEGANSSCFLVKLGDKAGGGVGTEQDIVGFSSMCAHMGGPLDGTYKDEHKAVGPCPFHLTTFDLTKHGMVIAGHATESLPQVVLEVRGGEIHAIGVMGLIFGTVDPRAV